MNEEDATRRFDICHRCFTVFLVIVLFFQAYQQRKLRLQHAEYKALQLEYLTNAMWVSFYEGSFRRQNAEEQFSNYVSNTIAGLRTPE
jgi:hypothetical protein